MRRPLLVLTTLAILGGFFAVTDVVSAKCCKCKAPGKNENICITTTSESCSDFTSKSSNNNIKTLQCTEELTQAQCMHITAGGSGMCTGDPVDEQFYAPGINNNPSGKNVDIRPIRPPSLSISIPGLQFASIVVPKDNKFSIPFLAQYISAVYRFLLGIGLIAAAIMVVYGGWLYMTAATGASVADGKKIIVDALIGLIILLTGTQLLRTVNPQTVEMNTLNVLAIPPEIEIIPPVQYEEAKALAAQSNFKPDAFFSVLMKENPSKNTAPVAGGVGGAASNNTNAPLAPIAAGGDGEQKPVPAAMSRLLINNPFDKRVQLQDPELTKISKEIGQKINMDYCMIKAVILSESGGHGNALGHDEDTVKSQKKTLASSGLTYTQLQAQKEPEGAPTRNDDAFVPTPPDYGLDWRFSHGFGPGGCTIFPESSKLHCWGQGPNGVKEHGRQVGGKCITPEVALTWEGGLECLALILSDFYKINKGDVCATFRNYIGIKPQGDNTCPDEPRLNRKMEEYKACKGEK